MKFNAKLIGGAVIGFIILISILGQVIPEAQTAGDNLGDENQCGQATSGCFYNASRAQACTENNVTSGDAVACSTPNAIALGGLFSGTGVVLLIVMAAIVLTTMGVFMYRRRK